MKTNMLGTARLFAIVASACGLAFAHAGGVDGQSPDMGACDAAGSQGSQGSQGNKQQDCYTETQVIQRLYAANAMEARVAGLVEERSESEEIQAYAEKLAKEHAQANEQLRELLEEDDVDLDAQFEPLNDAEARAMREQQKTLKRLQGLEGERFDRAFLQAIVKSHQMALDKQKVFAKSIEKEELKEFLESWKETVEEHLEEAKDLLAGLDETGGDADDGDADVRD